MMYEVELKAWVDDWDAVEARLREECPFVRSFRKEDRYFSRTGQVDPQTSFRVRLDDGSGVVTFKDKRVRDGVEYNQEREFAVDDSDAFVELVVRTGCRQYAEKVKEGLEFRCEGLTVELVRVKGLGDFVEIEAMEPSPRPEDHEQAAKRVRAFLALLGIDAGRIEERPYISLLDGQKISQDRPRAR